MASISQPFRLAALPKIQSLNNYASQSEYLQAVDNLSAAANKVNVGISGSNISQYLINPTPKLVFNLSIPSTNIVTACDVIENSDKVETWLYALEARKVSHLHLVTKPAVEDAVSSSSSEVTAQFKYKLKAKAVSVKAFPEIDKVIVVLKNGLIHTFSSELKLVNTVDIAYDNVKYVEFFQDEQGNKFVFVLCQLKEHKTCYKLYQINPSITCTELNSIILENMSLENTKICYQLGVLYLLRDGNSLSSYQLPHLQLQAQIDLPFIEKDSVVSIKPVASNRVLVTSDNKIYLVDLLYNALLFEKEVKNMKCLQLLSTGVIPNSAENRKTLALVVSTRTGPNPSSYLDIINVDVGSGTLKHSMGKGFLVKSKQKLQSLFEHTDEDDEDELLTPDYDDVIKQLKTCKKAENFDSIFFKKLSLSKEYYTDNDRFLNDSDFLSQIINILFQNYSSTYPKALTYLLTHPLFPSAHTAGLLAKLKSDPRLFKQCIVTCPNLPLDDLLLELLNITNAELCFDITCRILQDYKIESIKTGIKKVEKMDVTNLLDMILDSSKEASDIQLSRPQIFELMSIIIDSIGLFSLDDDHLKKLSAYIDAQVATMEGNVELLHLLDNKTKPSIGSKNKSSSHLPTTQPQSTYTVEYLEC